MTFSLSDFDMDDEDPPDPDCVHPKTANKFSGAVICVDCSQFLGYWSAPRSPGFPAVQNPDGTFRITV